MPKRPKGPLTPHLPRRKSLKQRYKGLTITPPEKHSPYLRTDSDQFKTIQSGPSIAPRKYIGMRELQDPTHVELEPSLEPKQIYTVPKRDPTQPKPIYTGTYVIGVSNLHKSNYIPVTSSEQALDLANMRRNKGNGSKSE
jgi:hypothetical protein